MLANKNFFVVICTLLQVLLDNVLELFLGWYWCNKQTVQAPTTKEDLNIITKSAVELAHSIRTGKLTSYQVVKAYTERMQATKEELNAIVEGPFLEALKEAKVLDNRIQNDDVTDTEWKQKPFLGVPFTTKDSTAVAGRLHTLGLLTRKTYRAYEDAECVRLIKKAGVIILATTNVPEVNKWVETRNSILGQTCNPYELRRSVGGSSGGEAAVISACCTAFGLGTDIGGSIRIPAFCCGIFGHKPTVKLVNTRGCTFRTGEEPCTMVVAGPMARSARDLLPLFKVLVGEELCVGLKLNESVNLKSLRYYYIPENGMHTCNPVNNDTQKVLYKVRQYFERLTGVPVALAKLQNLELNGKMWRYWMTQEPADFNKLLGNGVTLNPYVEFFKKLFWSSDYIMASIYSLIDSMLPEERASLMRTATAECKRTLSGFLGNYALIFFHSSPRTAPFNYYSLYLYIDFSYFSIFNVLHVPVTEVPMGRDSQGLPQGIQVVASDKNDRFCLAVAEELGSAFGGWVSPFKM